MQAIDFLDFGQIPGISELVVHLSSGKPIVKGVQAIPKHLADFEPVIKQKLQNYSPENRQKLVEAFSKQYAGIGNCNMVDVQLKKLANPNCLTVSCGHQLVIFGGPMYVAFKILSVIKLAAELEVTFPQYQFVPVHWMHGEDHDVEEIKRVSLFGKPLVWDTDQTGTAGHLQTETLSALVDEVCAKGEDQSAQFFSSEKTLLEATFRFLHHWYGPMGLLLLNASEKGLKEVFLPVAERELKDRLAQKAIDQTSKQLESLGYKPQIQPREINLFWIDKGQRYRMAPHADGVTWVGTEKVLSKAEMLELMASHCENVSPNVALRPLYSQIILPDVAFAGGPAEIAYWVQFADLFQQVGVHMPVLLPRFSAMVLKKAHQRKLEKWEMSASAFFENEHNLKREWLAKTSDLPLNIKTMEQELENWWGQLAILAAKTDPSLEPWVLAEQARITKQAEHVFKRILKAGETGFEADWLQFQNLKNRLLPGGHLQERDEAWLGFCLNNPNWLQQIYQQIEVLKPGVKVLLDA